MRRAQNSVLQLIGVVEERGQTNQNNRRSREDARRLRRELLDKEDELGAIVDVSSSLLEQMSVWWLGCIIRRYQAGLYNPDQSLTAIFSDLWISLCAGGPHPIYANLFAGSLTRLTFASVRIGCYVGIDAIAKITSQILWFRRRSTSKQKTLDEFLRIFEFVARRAVDIAFLPLDYHIIAQQLGLAPAIPILPQFRFLYGPGRVSTFCVLRKPFVGASTMGILTSPAVLLAIRAVLTDNIEAADEQPISGTFTNFSYAEISESGFAVAKPSVVRDPCGWILYHAFSARVRVMHWCGWCMLNLGPVGSSPIDLDTDMNIVDIGHLPAQEAPARDIGMHRSTMLARLPARFLANRIDRIFGLILTLPFESLISQEVAKSYLQSPLPRQSASMDFNASPSSVLAAIDSAGRPPGCWLGAMFGGYIPRVLLAIALQAAINATTFAAVYALVRWHGRRYFDWGNKQIGTRAPSSRHWLP